MQKKKKNMEEAHSLSSRLELIVFMEKDAGDNGPDLGEVNENLSSFSIRKGPQLIFCCDLGREIF